MAYLCVTSNPSTYYDFYDGSGASLPECNGNADGYPDCLCGDNEFYGGDAQLACGPMVEYTKAYSYMTGVFHSVRPVGFLYDLFNRHVILCWTISFVLFLIIHFSYFLAIDLISRKHKVKIAWSWFGL